MRIEWHVSVSSTQGRAINHLLPIKSHRSIVVSLSGEVNFARIKYVGGGFFFCLVASSRSDAYEGVGESEKSRLHWIVYLLLLAVEAEERYGTRCYKNKRISRGKEASVVKGRECGVKQNSVWRYDMSFSRA